MGLVVKGKMFLPFDQARAVSCRARGELAGIMPG